VTTPLSEQAREDLLQALERKIPSVADLAVLQESVMLALALLLRRPEDADLRAQLEGQIRAILAEIPSGQPVERIQNDLHFAARRCLKVLHAASEHRLPRHDLEGASAFRREAHHPPPPRPTPRRDRLWAALGAAAVVAAALILWQAAHLESASDPLPAAKLAEEIILTAGGAGPPTHVFGGALKLDTTSGQPVAVAEGVPPRACVAVGWELVRKGVLTINGVTPPRVSAAKITELCNSEDGDATIIWTPKR
jgi:hypothetical protein